LTAWVVPLDLPLADLQLGGVVLFRWMHKSGGRGAFHHLGNFGPYFDGRKRLPLRDQRRNGCSIEGREGWGQFGLHTYRLEEMGWWFWRVPIGRERNWERENDIWRGNERDEM